MHRGWDDGCPDGLGGRDLGHGRQDGEVNHPGSDLMIGSGLEGDAGGGVAGFETEVGVEVRHLLSISSRISWALG